MDGMHVKWWKRQMGMAAYPHKGGDTETRRLQRTRVLDDKDQTFTIVYREENKQRMAAGALGVQVGGSASPSLGFDPNLPAKRWRVVWNWVETRGDHAPEGATFEGSHDPAAAWNNANDGS